MNLEQGKRAGEISKSIEDMNKFLSGMVEHYGSVSVSYRPNEAYFFYFGDGPRIQMDNKECVDIILESVRLRISQLTKELESL